MGTSLLDTLIDSGVEVNLLALPGDSRTSSYKGRATIFTGDLNSGETLRRLVEDCSVVFHLAAIVHEAPLSSDPEAYYRVNVRGTANLIQACARQKVQKIVYYSTVGVYGNDGDFHGDEQSACHPRSPYAESKYQAERLLLENGMSGGPAGVILRFPVAYGPLDRGNVLRLIRGIDRRRFVFLGDGRNVRSMISSRNAAEAAVLAAVARLEESQVFCVTDRREYPFREIVDVIRRHLKTEWKPPQLPLSLSRWVGRAGDWGEKILRTRLPVNSATIQKLGDSLTFSCERAERMLGYKPVETLSEGIEREVAWYRRELS